MIITKDTDLAKLSKALEQILAAAPVDEPEDTKKNATDLALYEVAQVIREALA